MVCEEKNSTVMVDLRQRECTVCQPSLEERLEVVDICDDVLTQDCQDDPLNPEPWTKFCDTNTSKVLNNGLTFKFEKSLPETIAVDLVQQSLGPINDLLADTAPSGTNTEDTIVVTTPRIKTSSKSRPRSQSETTEDVSEILKILTQKKTETRGSDNFYFGQTATSTPASRPVTGANWPSPSSSSSVYFNPVLNTRPLPSQYQDTTQSSLTEFLNFQLQKQFSSPATPVRNSVTVMENQSSVKIKPSELITTTKSDKDEFTTPRIPVFEVETTAITSAKTMTSSKVLTTTTTTTGSVSLTTQKSQISETNESQSRVTLTPSEVIQLCFLNSSYCDFSKNEVLVSNRETTTALTTTSLATTLEMEIAVTMESTLLIAKQEDIKDRIRKCFLTGECGDIGQQRGSVDQRVVTTTETLISSTPSPRDAALRRRVKERARACLFEGKCN